MFGRTLRPTLADKKAGTCWCASSGHVLGHGSMASMLTCPQGKVTGATARPGPLHPHVLLCMAPRAQREGRSKRSASRRGGVLKTLAAQSVGGPPTGESPSAGASTSGGWEGSRSCWTRVLLRPLSLWTGYQPNPGHSEDPIQRFSSQRAVDRSEAQESYALASRPILGSASRTTFTPWGS